MTLAPSRADVLAAAARIRPFVHRTPVATCEGLDRLLGARLFFKCENLQHVGAFKMRGASNALARLPEAARRRGVVTHSSGNHAQAVARAAREMGIPATIVMPETAPVVKREATAGYGARIVACGPTQADREAATEAVIAECGAHLVHAYEDPDVIAGQGTAVLELLEDVEDLDLVLVPVGGGGLASGSVLAASDRPDVEVVGCEPQGADDAWRSLNTGVRVRAQEPNTIADGLRTVLGERPFAILRAHQTRIARAGEDEIRSALVLLFERAKLVVEPSAAVPLAAVLGGEVAVANRRVGVVLSGGNIDLRACLVGTSDGARPTP